MSIAPGSRLGPYEVLSALGAGGMGEVWRARDTRLGRDLALKVLPAEVASDQTRLGRFQKEAQSASALNHPNIVTVYEIGLDGPVPYIAMELVEGRTVRELLDEGPIPVRKLLNVGAQIADGLARAHEAGIVHRDLKPENLMVTKDGRVKILDFGLAKLSQPEPDGAGTAISTVTRMTEPGVVMGTVGYMSPEQAKAGAVDYRSDQFALGSILYEMATGRRAFSAGSKPELLASIIRDEPEPIAAVNPRAPAPLRWIVERCLAKEPEARYASSTDLARDLASVRDHLSETLTSGASPSTAPSRRRLSRTALVVAVPVALAGTFLLGRWVFRPVETPPSFQRVTFRSGSVLAARFAPDGQTIVYDAAWGSDPPTTFTTRVGSVESRPLGTPPGAQLLSISSAGELLLLRGRTLARASLAGGAEREILDDVSDAVWAPNGRDIAVVRRTGPAQGARMAVTGMRLEFPIGKILLETTYPLDSPRVSPRADAVAVVEHPFRGDMRGSLSVVDSAGRKRKLSEDFSLITNAAWSAPGDEIWFSAAAANEGMCLRAVDLSGRQRVVARGPGSQVIEDVSSDGRVLLIHQHDRGVLMASTPGDARERDLSWLDNSTPVDISDDGRSLLFSELGEGSGSTLYSVWKRPTDGSAAVRLGEGRACGFSPDGKWALAVRLQPQPAQLVLIPTGAGETRTLTQDAINHRAASLFPDGRRVLFVGDEPGKKPRLYVQSLDGGAPRAISREAAGGTIWMTWRPISPDSLWVVWFDGRFLLYPVDGGEPRPVPGMSEGEVPIGWTPDGRALWIRSLRNAPIQVFRLDVATGERRLWKEIPSPRGYVQMVMTPDGSSYAYGYESGTSDLYLAEGLR